MCKALNNVSGLTPAKILESYRNKFDSYTVDIKAILNYLNISCFEYDFSSPDISALHLKNFNKIKGAIVLRRDDLSVFVSKKCSDEEQRFIMAHELGHCCLHSDSLKNNKIEYATDLISFSGDTHEDEADRFAMELLIPEDNLRFVYKKLKVKYVSVLADIFSITIEVMRKRLDDLNLVYE